MDLIRSQPSDRLTRSGRAVPGSWFLVPGRAARVGRSVSWPRRGTPGAKPPHQEPGTRNQEPLFVGAPQHGARSAGRASLLVLLLLFTSGLTAAEGHRFDGIGIYKYELVQDVTWTSAGDQLAYRTEMRWELSLIGLGPGADGGQLVEARILQVDALHRGPGSHHLVHAGGSRPASGHDDPLLGNLLALVDVPLHLLVDPATGQVRQVEGHQAIIDRLVAQHPGPPGSPSPIAGPAAAAYGPERLARLWSTILMVPGQGVQRIPLEEPLSGEAIRRWEGSRYHLSLAEDQSSRAVLHTSPGRVELGIRAFSGGGSVSLVEGVLQAAEGTVEATLQGTAMSQDLRQQHRIRWTLARLALQTPSPPAR